MNNSFKRCWKDLRPIRRMFDYVMIPFRGSFIHTFLVYFSVFLAKRAKPALSLPKPYLEPSLALGKKYRLIGPFFGILISFQMILFCVCLAHARQQGLGTPVATGVALSTDSIKPLKIGDAIPEALWDMPVQMVKAGQEGSITVRLNDYRGKLIILDFWATWCSPCIAMIPKADSLQKQFSNNVQILQVAYQKKHEIKALWDKLETSKAQKFTIPCVVEDRYLSRYFPYKSLPHYVWIDSEGIVSQITSMDAVTQANISSVIAKKRLNLSQKIDKKIPYDRNRPLLIANNGGSGDNLIFHSLFSSHTEGLSAGYTIVDRDSTLSPRISATNNPITMLYALAYGEGTRYFGQNRIFVETIDKERLVFPGREFAKNWMKENTYSYEIIVPPSMRYMLYSLMQRDLALLFPQYKANVESRLVKCLALIRTSNRDLIKSKGGTSKTSFDAFGAKLKNFPLDRLIAQLNAVYLQRNPLPVIDQTDYNQWVDLNIEASLSNVDAMNKELKRYDLTFVEKEVEIEVLVIKDNTNGK